MIIHPTSEADKPLLEAWIRQDPTHSANGMTPEFFFEKDTDNVRFDDDAGPVCFFRFSKALRLHTQFNGDKKRTSRMLLEAVPWIIAMARQHGYKEILFESVSPTLIRFARRRFGFTPSTSDFLLHL